MWNRDEGPPDFHAGMLENKKGRPVKDTPFFKTVSVLMTGGIRSVTGRPEP